MYCSTSLHVTTAFIVARCGSSANSFEESRKLPRVAGVGSARQDGAIRTLAIKVDARHPLNLSASETDYLSPWPNVLGSRLVTQVSGKKFILQVVAKLRKPSIRNSPALTLRPLFSVMEDTWDPQAAAKPRRDIMSRLMIQHGPDQPAFPQSQVTFGF